MELTFAAKLWIAIGIGLVLAVLGAIGHSRKERQDREEAERRHRELLEAVKQADSD